MDVSHIVYVRNFVQCQNEFPWYLYYYTYTVNYGVCNATQPYDKVKFITCSSTESLCLLHELYFDINYMFSYESSNLREI